MLPGRREFLKLAAAGSLSAVFPSRTYAAPSRIKGRVVVIGAGCAGATAAKYLRKWGSGELEVMLVEPNPAFVSCPLSNLVLGGSVSLGQLTFGYERLASYHDIRLVRDQVTAIDAANRNITLARGELGYDRLIIAAGIDFIYDGLPMLAGAEAQRKIPHAWKAGEQTINLRAQMEAMPDGGTIAVCIPKAPYRCPPGPYERVCQIAFYLRSRKPKSHIIVLDANPDIVSKKEQFTRVWAQMYPGLVDYRPNSAVELVDVDARSIRTEFESVRAGVINLIPPQRAAKAAQMAGLANVDRRWCEVDFLTYESKLAPNVHVIGDSVASALPKSAHMATSQAKVCANAIVSIMSGETPDPQPVFANTCYSFVDDRMAMHVANVYRYDSTKKAMLPAEGGGVSEKPSELEGNYARYWAQNIWSDMLS